MSSSRKQIGKRIAFCCAIAAWLSLATSNSQAGNSDLIQLAVATPDAILAEQFWNTNGTSSTWTASNWGASAGGPFTNGWTANNNANFTANSLITYVTTTNVGNINVTNSSTVTLTAAGTYTTGGVVRTFDVGTGSILDFAAQSMSTAAGTGFIKNGNGIYFTSNGNSFTGGFTLNAGTVIIGGVNALGNGGALTINGGTLSANASRTLTGRFTSFTIGGDFTMGAVTTGVGSGNGSSAANISIDTNAGLGAATRTITIGSNATYSLLGILSGSSGTGLNVAASGGATGNLVLSGANTFNGGTTVNSGILVLGSSSTASGGALINGPVGTGLLTLNDGAAMRSNGATDRTILNNVSLSGNITLGSATNTGVLRFNSVGLSVASTVTLAADTMLTLNSDVRIGNKITGVGRSLSKMGSGMLDLDVANDFSGTFTANGGTTNLNVNNALGSVTSVVVNNGANLFSIGNGSTTNVINDAASVTINGTGNLDLSGGSETVGSLASSSSASTVITGAFGGSAGSLTVGDSSNTTFAGVISGAPLTAGATIFTKQGAGTLTLTGANTYTGATVINNGTIALDNNNTTTARLTGTTKITVNSGGTLLLSQSGVTASTDRINNSATITLNGGTFNTGGLSEYSGSLGPLPGGKKGPTAKPEPKPIVTTVTAGIGALTLQSSSVIDLANGKSILAFANSSAATWTSGQVLSIWNWSGNLTGAGTDQIYFGTDTTGLTSGQLAQIEFFSGAGTGSYGLGVAALLANGELVPIPEPSSWIGGALALAAVGFTQRRRLKRARVCA